MGMLPTDSIPREMSQIEIYKRVWAWYRANVGLIAETRGDYFKDNSEAYILEMPHPGIVTTEQMKNIFNEVLMSRLEWAYHHKDEYGYTMAAYAHAALETS